MTPGTVTAPRLLCPWDFPNKNTGVACHFLHRIFPTQGSNPHILPWQADSLPLSHQEALQMGCAVLSHSVVSDSLQPQQAPVFIGTLQARILEWVATPSSWGSSQPRTEPRSPALQVDSLPSEPPGKPKCG